jgi:hypothetical protein
MAWTEITRRHYRREGLRYGSDTTDAEWLVMEPLLPPASALGRPRATDLRTVIDAILYIASTGCQWRQLPKDFPPYSTVQGYFYAWSRGGIFASLTLGNDGLSDDALILTKTSFFCEALSNRPVQSRTAFPETVQLPLHGVGLAL